MKAHKAALIFISLIAGATQAASITIVIKNLYKNQITLNIGGQDVTYMPAKIGTYRLEYNNKGELGEAIKTVQIKALSGWHKNGIQTEFAKIYKYATENERAGKVVAIIEILDNIGLHFQFNTRMSTSGNSTTLQDTTAGNIQYEGALIGLFKGKKCTSIEQVFALLVNAIETKNYYGPVYAQKIQKMKNAPAPTKAGNQPYTWFQRTMLSTLRMYCEDWGTTYNDQKITSATIASDIKREIDTRSAGL